MVSSDPLLPITSKLVLIGGVVTYWNDKTGACFPTHDQLADRTALSSRTVRSGLDMGKSRGFLIIDGGGGLRRNHDGTLRGFANTYAPAFEGVPLMATEEPGTVVPGKPGTDSHTRNVDAEYTRQDTTDTRQGTTHTRQENADTRQGTTHTRQENADTRHRGADKLSMNYQTELLTELLATDDSTDSDDEAALCNILIGVSGVEIDTKPEVRARDIKRALNIIGRFYFMWAGFRIGGSDRIDGKHPDFWFLQAAPRDVMRAMIRRACRGKLYRSDVTRVAVAIGAPLKETA